MKDFERRKSKKINIGSVAVGGGENIAVQSMTNTDTHDYDATYRQTSALAAAGCDIVRITFPDTECVGVIDYIKSRGVKVPLVADIHFDYKIALEAAAAGIDKIRINPGNIGSVDRVKAVADACKAKNIPIRIGVNSGSVEKSILAKFGGATADAICESALYHASLLEKFDFTDILISAKASDVKTTIAANRLLAEKCEYPLHIGVTESGSDISGIVKSAVGIGTLLSEGIGDTIRVSLTENPLREVDAAYEILNSLDLNPRPHINIISCPTCGRTKIDLITITAKLKKAIADAGLSFVPITVAVMGCAVNGPGEAAHADIGIAGGSGEALYFEKGIPVRKLPEEEIISHLIAEIKRRSDA